MKKIIYILSFLLNPLFSDAQTDSLPQGNCRIVLKSGKSISTGHIRSIGKQKIEFEFEGNLTDESTETIEFIEATEYLIWFDENQNRYNRPYDFLVLESGDSLKGSVQKETHHSFVYVPFGSNRSVTVEKSSLKKASKPDQEPTEKVEGSQTKKPLAKQLPKPPPQKGKWAPLWASIAATAVLVTIFQVVVVSQNNHIGF